MTAFVTTAMLNRQLGLALHYPLLHAAVVGLAARRTFEFGAGGSTRVILDALGADGQHLSVSTETREDVSDRHGIANDARWLHVMSTSAAARDWLPDGAQLDLVLHDGAHDAATVARDIEWIWPRLRRFGLLLVHDSQHSYVGNEVREGLRQGLKGLRFSATTLPYGFGLTIARREDGGEPVVPGLAKISSPHATVPCSIWSTP